MKKDNLQYNGDFSNIIPISKLKKQVFINALSTTNTLTKAAAEIGVSSHCVHLFLKENNITNKDIELLRTQFKLRGIKIKLRY
jgi:hypothetical protein